MPTLDSLTFDTTGLRFDQQDADQKVWFTSDGDDIILNFIDAEPTWPPNMRSLQEAKDFFLSKLADTGIKLVELSILNAGGCQGIRIIVKSPQKPHGMRYLGSITFPFRNFSFVLKAQCEEHGMTGIREAILFDKMRRSGEISIDASGKITGALNTDSLEYDDDFPQHPLSRLRKLLHLIETTAVLDPAVVKERPFPLPISE